MPSLTPEQLLAVETEGTNILVSAGAGSGKTQVLSKRVINKLLHGTHINELLVLTFTKAAASEMKDRIRKKIAEEESLKEELKLLSSSYITTFDSFALSVVKKYSYLLNLSPNIEITDESVISLKQIELMDKVFESLYEKKDSNFENLINKYCVKTDKTLRKNILDLSKIIDTYVNKNEYLDNIKNNFYNEENINNILKRYSILLEEKRSYITLELDNLNYYFDSDYVDKVRDSLVNILNSKVEDLHLITKVTLPKVPNGSSNEAKDAKAKLKSAVDDLLKYSTYGSYENIKKDIYDSKEIVFEIIEIIKEYFSELEKYKKENNIYTFSDIARLSLNILKNFKEARGELTNSFKEIMIDEYQDTSDIQEEFISLISNNNVYSVGDIKQSIYRFRGTNPKIFKDKYDKYGKNIDGVKIDLIKNFRSRDEVLRNINKIFELLMDNNLGGAEYKESHEMFYGNTTYDTQKDDIDYNIDILEYENSTEDYTNSEIEIFTICKDIKDKINKGLKVFDKELNKLRKATYNDFVIILDRSKYFDDFKKIFEYASVPLTILKDDKLNVSTDISLIKNIIDIILRINSKDYGVEFKYDLLSIGRSYLYEISDQELYDTLTNKEYYKSQVYKDFSKIESLNSKTSSELLEEVLNITDFYNKIYKIGDFESVNTRLKTINELSKTLNKLGLTIEEFRDYLDNVLTSGIDIKYTSNNTSTESVKIMTIHKSKGLEYPICYYADLNHKFNDSELKTLFISSNDYGLIIPSMMEETDASVLKELYKRDFYKEEISEKIRLFYVALTRAREKMIIVIPKKEPEQLEKDNKGVITELRRQKFTKLSDMVYGIKYYLKDYFKDININDLNLTKNYLYKKELNEIKTSTNESFIVEEINILNEIVTESHFSKESNNLVTKDEKENMEYGTKVHEVFELIDFKNYNESDIKDEFIREKVNKFLNHELLKNVKNANIYHEYEFNYTQDNTEYHGIIDLMLEYNDHIDIIDYKLKNVMDEHYKDQLNGYKNYIKSISNKEVNTYLYSIINEEITEIN